VGGPGQSVCRQRILCISGWKSWLVTISIRLGLLSFRLDKTWSGPASTNGLDPIDLKSGRIPQDASVWDRQTDKQTDASQHRLVRSTRAGQN